MKRLFTAFLVLGSLCLSAQVNCLSDEMRRQQFTNDPALRQQHEWIDQQIAQLLRSGNVQRSITGCTIPVVVHIIHNNGPENISNAQVLAGIQHTNEAFSNTGAFQYPDGVNTGIQLCLAQQDENGVFTTGINRVTSTLTNMTSETDDAALKNLIRWDPTRYLNIWIVNEITSLAVGAGVNGYAFMPAAHGQPEDGIVVEAAFFGTTADNSKVIVHELGHYLGLYHTFEGGCTNNDCLSDGDKVCDTPPDNSTAAVNCSATPNTCATDDDDLSVNNPFRPVSNGGLGDQPDLFQDYMDYGYATCQHLFTDGQKNRMVTMLTTVRASLLQSNGCVSPCTSPITIGFNLSASVITTGGSVTFTNTTAGAASYTWFIGSQQIATTTNANYTFITPGYYNVTLVASNGDIACEETLTQVVLVNCGAQASFSVSPPGPYNPGVTLTFTNTSSGATTYEWVLDGVSQGSPTNFMQTFNNAGGHSIYLVASDGQCSDTSTASFFQIGHCNLSNYTANWILPSTALYFNGSNPPVSSVDTTMDPAGGFECSSSMSDPNGNLIFYTEGARVFNRNHVQMPNGFGLLGHPSANQTCMIAPDPGNPNRYYVFTVDAWNTYTGLKYTLVDMTLDNGLGDVLPASKNTPVAPSCGEQLTGVYHANGRDIWITVISVDGNTVYNYLLTANGLATTPVTSVLSTFGIGNGGGAIKYSHDGRRFAANITRNFQNDGIRICDFDPATGMLSNMFEVTVNVSGQGGLYGMEYSPDNSKLYFADFVTYIYQLDLSAGSPSAIAATLTQVDPYNTTAFHTFGHLELALDGKIYIAYNSLHIDCIPNPNLAGTACGYVQDAAVVQFAINICLPNFVRGLYQAHAPYIAGPDTVCTNTAYVFPVMNGASTDSVVWEVRGSGTISTASASSCTFVAAATPGADTLFITDFGLCGVTTDTLVLHTFAAAAPSLGADRPLCTTMQLSPGTFASYLWQNNSTGATLTASTPGTYWVTVTNSSGCSATDSITLTPAPNLPPVDLGNDMTVCVSNAVVLNAGNYAQYTWQNGSHNSTFTAYLPGTYWVTVSDGCNSSTDSIHIVTDESAFALDLGNDTLVCVFPFTIDAPPGYSYLWIDGSSAMTFQVDTPGVFWVTVTDVNGCSARDTLTVQFCMSTGDDPAASGWEFYPNPANDAFTIDFGKETAVEELMLFDATGRTVREMRPAGMLRTYQLHTATLAEGVYVLQIRTGEGIVHRRIIVQHR